MGEAHRLVSPARVFARPTADETWLGPTQRSALSQLSRPAHLRLVAGPASSGRTTLLQKFGAHFDPNAVVLQCRGPKDDAAAVLASLLLSADLGPWDLSEIEQRNLLTVLVHQRQSQNRRVLVLVDDVHTFSSDATQELERLLALRIAKTRGIELLLAGPSGIVERWQRMCDEGATVMLTPPSPDELVAYLEWRLRRFELQTYMTPTALQLIARLSGGRFGAANVLCQMSLLMLRQLALSRVDARVVRQAVAALGARQSAKLEGGKPRSLDDAAPAPPPGHLILSRNGKMLTRLALRQRTLIGRSEHNDLCLPSQYLSRHHAVIVGTPQGYYVVDLNSSNGVLVNGRRVERAVLCHDDVLHLGPFRLKVHVPEWLAEGNPLPEQESLADTSIMPRQTDEGSVLRRVK